MKIGFLAFRRAACCCFLLFLSGVAHAATITNIIFSDHFESGAVQLPAGVWTTTGSNPLDPSTPTNVVPGGGAFSAFMNTSIDRMHRNLGAELSGTVLFTFYIFDEGTNAGTVGATRVYNELRGYSGGSGLPNGGTVASGTLAALLAAGKFNSTTLPGDVFTNTKYQGRVAFGPGAGGTTGWFNLNGPGSPNRSFGWHRFDIEVLPPGDTVRFYVDGILCRTFTGAAIETYDTVVMGPGLGSQLGGAWIDGISVAVLTTPPPINLTCPPNLNVTTASPSGQPVNYFVNATGGCSPPPTLNCVPPSGSNFPLGTTTVNCSASDTCSQTANCSFTITLTPPVGTEVFVQTNTLPPAAGAYVSPAQWHQAYANGIIISNASHNRFVGALQPPPPAGGSNTHTFNSSATFDISIDNGATFQPAVVSASVTVGVGHLANQGGRDFFSTEMQSFQIQGGSLPPGVIIRESPTLSSVGSTTVRPVAGGYMTSSSFDIHTEVSTDGGVSWTPGNSPIHVELRKDFTSPPVPEPTDLLPPPNDHYVSPADWHAAYAAGIVIKDVSHNFFTQSMPPPPSGGSNTHSFGSTLDLEISLDGGATFTSVRVSSPVNVSVTDAGAGTFDTEMYGLTLQGGDLPPGVMVRESPTEPSRGRTRVTPVPGGTYHIDSFFDIFTEVSLDGGANWSPATNGPVHVRLEPKAPEAPFPTPTLPPPGQYVSPSDWHAYYAMGIYISNVSHLDFTQRQPPPPPGGSQPHGFNSAVQMLVSMDGGATYNPVTAPANVFVNVSSTTSDTATTRFFDTEMLALDIQGGGLPPGLMIRESPTRASTGRTSIRQVGPGDYRISSFFDIFTELSIDGGASWHPALSGPASVHVTTLGTPPVTITCPADVTVASGGPGGAVVNYSAPVVGGGCSPPVVTCNPPSGSNFPNGTTAVTCMASDSCGSSANCSFNVAVNAPAQPVAEVFVTTAIFPPTNAMYIDPQTFHTLYQNGVYINDPSHYFFTGGALPPPVGVKQPHTFGSLVDATLNIPGSGPFLLTAPAGVSVSMSNAGTAGGAEQFETEMEQLDIMGGGLPPGVMVRESPTLRSTGRSTLRPVPGGYMASSFFDIFTEISMDGGATWSPAQAPAHMQLRKDPRTVPPIDAPSDLLPPPNGSYVSPADYHAAYAAGIIIKDVSHSFFTQSQPPPASGSNTHTFNSQVDLEVSTDGGATFTHVRVGAPVSVGISRVGNGLYDTEMLSLDLTAGLPGGLMIRESPTLRSGGGVSVQPNADGTFRIHSFFDIFTEISTDGGASWSPATSGPVHVELKAPVEQPVPTPDLPPLNGEYISPEKWHQLYANGIIISNASHDRFTQSTPPPPPGGSQTHGFGSQVHFDLIQPGQPPLHVTAPAVVQTHLISSLDSGNTRYFDTEMLTLNIGGGGLPAGIRVRESPTKASLGRTSVRAVLSDGSYRIGSFFDIFTEISLDGGATWSPAVSGPVTMALNVQTNPPVAIACPADVSVPATGPGGAVVNYPAPTPSGGCTPPTVVCNPPSGSNFPVGTTPVTCTASDTCGGSANCTFNVTVTPPVVVFPPPVFAPTPHLPPTNGIYISPATFHQLYANGIIIRDVKHNRFTGGTLPPPPGGSLTHSFGSMVSMEVSFDGGVSFQPHTAPASVSTHVASAGQVGSIHTFDTEMLQLSIGGGTLPAGVLVRESPTLASTGGTRMTPEGTGQMISSFFDVFTELSLDGGATWSPAQSSTRVELRKDPTTIPPALVPTGLLPPPNGQYISPQRWHALYANGIIISNVSHRRFTQGFLPPASGSQNHNFGSDVSLQLSLDGGQSFISYVGPCDASVEVTRTGSDTFDTEMLSLSLSGGNLPPGLMIRESPTRRSSGGTAIRSSGLPPGDPDFDLLRVHSFFDIFTELSLDGGMTWSPNTNGPVQMELAPIAPEKPFPTPDLPPLNGQYVSPQQWHALFAQGIVISNVSHQRFLSNTPPPPPGGSVTHTFGSQVNMMLSLDNGATFAPVSTFADVTTHVSSSQDEGGTRYFDTEMLALNLNGGGLPAGVMIRESPTRASTGKTSLRQPAPGDYRISSFFDIFIELSVDGGATWNESLGGAATVTLDNLTNTPVSITCPPDQNAQATGPSGVVVNYPPPNVGGGCTPPNVVCNPPSGSTFPVGTTTVTCTASDSCGSSATCTFNVTVSPQPPPPAPEIFFKTNGLPPLDGVYISPALFHQLYANGIIIRDIRHARFTQNLPPPPPGPGQTHSFDSVVELEASTDGGLSYQKFSAPAAVRTRVVRQGATDTFDTEMLQLNVAGGTLPPGVMVRESPTQASTGQTTVRPVPGGYMIGSFFDIFTELSLDGGANWVPASQTTRVELRRDPRTAPPQNVPSNRLPPRNGAYVSPAEWHQAYANGIVISNISHARFTDTLPPPPPGDTQTHQFDSHIDLMLSQDGGATYIPVRVNAVVDVGVVSRSSSPGQGTFDTEMLAMTLSGGGLPAGVMIRESPTLPSRGGVQMDQQADGTFHVSSFFDIFTELSVDGGNNWQPATTGPARVELRNQATERPFPTPQLPPPAGQYVSPQQWHALFANGIVISNVSHQRFLQSQPPPPPGGTNQHTFGSTVNMLLSMNGGATFTPASASADVTVRVGSTEDDGDTRFFDTEMLQLSLQGGSLPAGVMIRESPTRQSTGGTSMRQPSGSTGFEIASFFDIFLEVSTDGGATWTPSTTGPSHVSLDTLTANPCAGPSSLTVERSPDGNSVSISWLGAGFRLQCTEVLESNSAATVWVDVSGASPVTQPIVPGKNRFYRVICP